MHLYLIIQKKKKNLSLEVFHLLFSGKAHSLRDSRDIFKEFWVNCFLFLRVWRCWTGWNNMTFWKLWLWYGGHRGRCFWTWQYKAQISVGHGTQHVTLPHYIRDIAGQSVLGQPCQKWGILGSSSGQFLGLLSIFFTPLLYQIPFFSSLQGNQCWCPKNTVVFLFHSSQSKQLCSTYTFHGISI